MRPPGSSRPHARGRAARAPRRVAAAAAPARADIFASTRRDRPVSDAQLQALESRGVGRKALLANETGPGTQPAAERRRARARRARRGRATRCGLRGAAGKVSRAADLRCGQRTSNTTESGGISVVYCPPAVRGGRLAGRPIATAAGSAAGPKAASSGRPAAESCCRSEAADPPAASAPAPDWSAGGVGLSAVSLVFEQPAANNSAAAHRVINARMGGSSLKGKVQPSKAVRAREFRRAALWPERAVQGTLRSCASFVDGLRARLHLESRPHERHRSAAAHRGPHLPNPLPRLHLRPAGGARRNSGLHVSRRGDAGVRARSRVPAQQRLSHVVAGGVPGGAQRRPAAVRAVLLTFDDARKSFWTVAMPLLRTFEARAVLFVPTYWMATPSQPGERSVHDVAGSARVRRVRPGRRAVARTSPRTRRDCAAARGLRASASADALRHLRLADARYRRRRRARAARRPARRSTARRRCCPRRGASSRTARSPTPVAISSSATAASNSSRARSGGRSSATCIAGSASSCTDGTWTTKPSARSSRRSSS